MSNYENMDDKDFYAFRKSLDKQRDIEFDESHWDELDARLDKAAKLKRRPVLGWWMLAAAAMVTLLLGNLFLFGKLSETRSMNTQLQDKVEQLVATPSNNQVDTIWKERIVYVYDTLTNEKIVYRTVKAVPEKYQQLQEMLTAEEIETILAGRLPQRLRALPGETQPIKEEGLVRTEEQGTLPETPTVDLNHVPDMLENSEIALLDSQYGTNPDWENYLTPSEWKEKKVPAMLRVRRAMTPNGFAVGLTGGPLFPISKKLHETKGSSAGLAVELVFSDHLRLRSDASFAREAYSSETMNPDLGVPVIPPPGDDFVFDKATVEQNTLMLNIGMKYLMNIRSKWQPFVYAGYGVSAVLPYKLYYDFEDSVLGTEVQVEQESEATYFNEGFGMASLGLSYALNDKLSFQLDGFYRSQLSKSSLSNPDLAGLRATALYQF